jgi:hypothetical protein
VNERIILKCVLERGYGSVDGINVAKDREK